MDQNRDQDQGQTASERWTDEQLEAIKAYGAEARDELLDEIRARTRDESLVELVDQFFAKSLARAEAARRKRVGASTG